MTRTATRPLTLLLALLLAVTTTLTWSADSDAAVPYPDAERLEGSTNVDIAVSVSQRVFADGGADAVVIARDNLFPDSLAATGFAGVANAPILFTNTASLSPATRDEIQRVLRSGTVFILGGPNAVSDQVKAQIEAMGYSTSRFRGADRFHTASLIANALLFNNPNISQVVIARGRGNPDATQGWVDAAACGAWAADRGLPILLVDPNGSPNGLPPQTESFLKNRDIRTAHLCGGPGAVTEAHASLIGQFVPNVFRYAGSNRAQTAIAAAEGLWKVTDPRGRTIVLAPGYGDRYAYGISASQLSAKLDAPMLLVDATSPNQCLGGGNGFETVCWLQDTSGPAAGLIAVGSTNIISDDVLSGAAAAAQLERDLNPPPAVEDLDGDDRPGDDGTKVRLTFSPVQDPEGADVDYHVYFREVAQPEPEPTEEPTEEPSGEPSEEPTTDPSEEPTEEPTTDPSEEPSGDPSEEPAAEPDPLTKENGTRATDLTVTETVIDEVPVVVVDVTMCGTAIPTDEEGNATSEVPQSTCKDTEFEFIVLAVDAGGNESAPSEPVTAAPVDDVPAAPANPPAPEDSSEGFTLVRWERATAEDAAGYVIERADFVEASLPPIDSDACGEFAEIARITDVATTSVLDNGTEPGGRYCYRYRLIDTTLNESENSPEVQFDR